VFYIEQDDKIVLYDKDRTKLQNTLSFMPQYKHLTIHQTDKEIVNYEGSFYFTDNEEYVEKVKQAEAERIAKLSLTKREVFLAIYNDKQITPEQIRAQITDQAALIEFDYAEKYYRGNPLIDILGVALGYTKEQLDYLFENKELPKVVESELENE
jgi:hydroxymethylpyrimidine pyrophosphatase-like HAD family hydrolase